MKLLENESKNRNYFYKELSKHLALDDPTVLIGTEVPVPYKHIYIPSLPITTLEVWCFKQDICVFQTLYDKSVGYRDACIVSSDIDEDPIINVRLEKDSSQNTHDVGLPYVIIETKMGKNVNTHELLAYSEKAQWSSPDFMDTLNCTCVSVSGGVSKYHLPSENATTALYAQGFFLTPAWIGHQAVFRSSSSSYSAGVR